MLIAITGKKNSGKDTLFKIISYLMLKYKYKSIYKRYYDTFEKYNSQNTAWIMFENKKFADKLKDIICLLLDCTREQLEDRDFKEKELPQEWWYYKLSQDKIVPRFHYIDDYDNQMCEERYLIKLTPRLLMQKIGTDLFRNQLHPNVWINSTFTNYDEKCDWIITDLRFQDELDKVKKNNGITIRILKDNYYRFEQIKGIMFHTWSDTEDFTGKVFSGIVTSWDKHSAYIEFIRIFGYSEHLSESSLDNNITDYTIYNNSTIDDLIEQVEKKLFIEGQIHLQYKLF